MTLESREREAARLPRPERWAEPQPGRASGRWVGRILAALCLLLLPACIQTQSPFRLRDRVDDTASFPQAQTPVPQPSAVLALDDGEDWMQLVSGEWIRGEFQRMREDEVFFDSDELDDLTIDFDKVAKIYTTTIEALVTLDNRILRGRIVMVDDWIWVRGSQTVQIPRSEVVSILELGEGSFSEWTAEASFGATIRSGNTEQEDFSLYANVIRRSPRTRWTTTYNGVLSRAGETETANNSRLRSAYDVFLSERWFLTVPSVEVYLDRLQNIDYRLTPSASVGYRVVDTDPISWEVSAGPAYQYTRFDVVAPGEDIDDSAFAAVGRSEFDWELSDDVDLGFDYSVTTVLDDLSDYNHTFQVRLSVDLTDDLTLDVGLVWDRVNQPVADQDGVVPEEDDYRTSIGLGWTL